MPKDYYDLLGVARGASQEEIKRAFRQKAKQYHPDANRDDPEAAERFKEINEAYEVLSDSKKRAQYDQFGAGWERFAGAGNGTGTAGAGGYQSVNYDDLQDILNSMFGGGAGRRGGASGRTGENPFGAGFTGFDPFGGFQQQTGPMRGQDIEHPLAITLEDAYHGKDIILTVDNRRLNVRIPAGAKTGTRVRLTGEGSPGAGGGPAGDLYLVIEVMPHPQFTRDGDDLQTDVEVDAFTAMLGGEAQVNTLTGHARLKIPAGTQAGRRFRLTGKGMPVMRQKNQRGDLYARVVITVPTSLTEQQRREIAALRRDLNL